jgi:hypothetical protein
VLGDGGEYKVGEGDNGGVGGGSTNDDGTLISPITPKPIEDLSRSFHGIVEIDPARLGGVRELSASRRSYSA